MQVGAVLKKLRMDRGWTILQAVTNLKMNPDQLQAIEEDAVPSDHRFLRIVAEEYEVDFNKLQELAYHNQQHHYQDKHT